MLTSSDIPGLIMYMFPWIGLVATWLWLFIKYEERKDARKEQNHG